MSRPLNDPTDDIKGMNTRFFEGNSEYADKATALDTYLNIRRAVESALPLGGRLLDVGNGGVFDYDTTLLSAIAAVDLFLDADSAMGFPVNCTPIAGDALDLPAFTDDFDAALYALVFHHLVAGSADETLANIDTAFHEAARALRPGRRLIVVESCVPRAFYRIERVAFRPLSWVARSGLMAHPPTLQITIAMLASSAKRAGFRIEHCKRIPVGRWIMQFGVKVPSVLTPARPWMLVASRE